MLRRLIDGTLTKPLSRVLEGAEKLPIIGLYFTDDALTEPYFVNDALTDLYDPED